MIISDEDTTLNPPATGEENPNLGDTPVQETMIAMDIGTKDLGNSVIYVKAENLEKASEILNFQIMKAAKDHADAYITESITKIVKNVLHKIND